MSGSNQAIGTQVRPEIGVTGAVAQLGGFPMVVDGRLAGVGERESVADVARVLGPQSRTQPFILGGDLNIQTLPANAALSTM